MRHRPEPAINIMFRVNETLQWRCGSSNGEWVVNPFMAFD